MDVRTVFIHEKQDVEIVCHHCWKIGTLPVPGIPKDCKEYKIKCQCGNSWIVKFERRRHLRKDMNSFGVIDWGGNEYFVNITGLSLSGCSLTSGDGRLKLNIGDHIHIRFRLDNVHSDLIECSAIVRNSGVRVGVEFTDMDEKMKRTLGFHFF